MEKNERVIGIDLGTTYSCVGIWEKGKVVILQNEFAQTTTPSIVSFDNKKINVGKSAERTHYKNNKNTIYDTKRLIGKKYNDNEIKELRDKLYYDIIENPDTEEPMIKINNPNEKEIYYVEDISQIIIEKLKKMGELYAKQKIKEAVITVPAYFNELQRKSTKMAAETAGLKILRIINEPTAAAIAYGLINENKNMKDRNILIFDLGGGTFDVTILLLSSDGIAIVKSTNGNSHLGGEDFTNKLVDYCVDIFQKENKDINLKSNLKGMIRLRNACEEGKIMLSQINETVIDVTNITKELDLNIKITRIDFEEMCKEYFNECINCINNAIIDAKLKKEDIEDIVLVGGSSKIPKIKEMVKKYFNREVLLKNITVNPQEAIAIGATYLANVIKGNIKDESVVLLDIIGMSLGIEIYGGKMEIILKKGTNIPFSSSKIFTTNVDNQDSIFINIYQGENEDDINKNYFLYKFSINNIRKGKAGSEEFEVIFTIDNNSCLTVTAKNVKNKETITVNRVDNFSRLNEKKYKELLNNNRERESINNKIDLMTLLTHEIEEGNPFANDLMNNLLKDNNVIDDELYNLYLLQLYPNDN